MKSVLQQLKEMTRTELENMAAEFSPVVPVKEHWTKGKIAGEIRKRQVLDAEKTEPKPEIQPQAPASNPDFEARLSGSEPEPEPEDNRGGARPGAGRPKGMTEEKAAARNLPTIPNQTLVQGLQFVFAMWEAQAGVRGVSMDEKEAENLALPYTQLMERYCPGLVSEMAGVWASAVCLTFISVSGRLAIIRAAKEAARAAASEPMHRAAA